LIEIVRPRRFGRQEILKLASHLTDRDRNIAKDCFEYRVLTTSQIKRLYFTGPRTASARLDVLYRLRVLDRFRPSVPMGEGTAPYHWILDEAGALIVADLLGRDRAQLGWRHSVATSIATSQNLAHDVEVNEFFTRLAIEANAAGGALSEWYGERTCRHAFSGKVVPDGWGVLTLPGREPLHFLVELDRGTEDSSRLRKKAEDYDESLPYSSLKDLDPVVLLVVPNAVRARTAAGAVSDNAAPIAVSIWSNATANSVLALVGDARRHIREVGHVTPADRHLSRGSLLNGG
jgi:hypothetical protein